MARDGTTTAEVKSGYALSHAGELRLLGIVPALSASSGLSLVPTYLGAHAVPPGAGDPRTLRRGDRPEDAPVIARRHLAAFCDVFCEPDFFSVEEARRILSAALSLGLGAKIHADEFELPGGARLAAELKARSAEHLLRTPSEDRDALGRAGVTAVLLPMTPFASMSGTRSLGREMVDAGVAVALGSDLSPNSWVESMPIVLSHAVYAARLTPAEAIVAATANAAHAIGTGDRAGAIAVGRWRISRCSTWSRSRGPVPDRVETGQVYRQGIAISSRESARTFK